MRTDKSIFADFLRGFEQVTGLDWPNSDAQWDAFACDLTEEDRYAIECGGYENGLSQGHKFIRFANGGPWSPL